MRSLCHVYKRLDVLVWCSSFRRHRRNLASRPLCRSHCRRAGLPGTDSEYVFVRQSASAQTLYLLVIAGTTASPSSNQFNLDAFVAGTFHSLAIFNVTVAANDVIRLSVTGNVLTVSQNATVIQTFTDTNNYVVGPGFPGLGVLTTNLSASYISYFSAGANQNPTPTFSPPAGTYAGTQTVTLNGPASSTIYYTTDGSTPTRSSSSVSTGGTISVSSSETVNAISSVSNYVDSTVAGAELYANILRQWQRRRSRRNCFIFRYSVRFRDSGRFRQLYHLGSRERSLHNHPIKDGLYVLTNERK